MMRLAADCIVAYLLARLSHQYSLVYESAYKNIGRGRGSMYPTVQYSMRAYFELLVKHERISFGERRETTLS